jgi:hypothetical protein
VDLIDDDTRSASQRVEHFNSRRRKYSSLYLYLLFPSEQITRDTGSVEAFKNLKG